MRVRDGGAAADRCLTAIADRIHVAVENLSLERTLKAQGVDSLAAVEILAHLSQSPGPVPSYEDFRLALLGDVRLIAPESMAVEEPSDGTPSHAAGLRRFAYLAERDPYVLQLVVRLDARVRCADLARVCAELQSGFYRSESDHRRVWHLCGHVTAETELTAVGDQARARCAERARDRSGTFEIAHVSLAGSRNGALLFTVHHSEVDLWSASLVLEEVDRLLAAAAAGRREPTRVTMVGDAQLAGREGRALADAGACAARDVIAAAVGALPSPATSTTSLESGHDVYRCVEYRRQLAPETSAAIGELARRLGVSRTAVCLLAFTATVARYTGRPSLLVGVPTWNRGADELRTLGPLTNTVPVPVRWDQESTTVSLLGQVDDFLTKAVAASRIPYTELLRRADPGASTTPPIDALFSLQEAFPAEADTPGLRDGLSLGWPAALDGSMLKGSIVPQARRTSEMPIDLAVSRTSEGYRARLVIDRRWGHGQGAEQFLDCFEELLRSSGDSTATATLTGPLECLRPVAWKPGNDTDGGPPTPLFELLRAHAQERPGSVAIQSDSGAMTYRELVDLIDLRAEGLPRDVDAVCIWPGEGVEAVLNLLAALRGAVPFFCFDGTERDDRARAVCEALPGRVAALISPEGPPAPAALEQRRIELLDGSAPSSDRDERDGRDQSVYFASTSGTSGQPKLVEVTAANLRPLVSWFAKSVGMGEQSTLIKTLSLGFDFGLEEVFAVLLNGGTLVVPDRRAMFAGPDFARACHDHHVNTWFTTPSLLQSVLSGGLRADGMRTVLVGGEAFTWSAYEQLRAAVGPDCQVWNGYGPTEATINSTAYLVDDGQVDFLRSLASTVPIGRPSAETVARVVDPRLVDVPIGVPGELIVGGPNVTAGYLGRESVSFLDVDGVAAYRTGDRVVRLGTGDLVYLGRMDREVKVRGVRLDVADIEAAICASPGVVAGECRVVKVAGNTHLEARLLTEAGADFELVTSQVREALRRAFPPQAVPTRFIPAETLVDPRTGKSVLTRSAAEHDPVLVVVLEVFGEITNGDQVDPDARFDALGGDEFLAESARVLLAARLGIRTASFDVHPSTTARGAARALRLIGVQATGGARP